MNATIDTLPESGTITSVKVVQRDPNLRSVHVEGKRIATIRAIDVDTMAASLFVRGVNLKAIPVAEVRALNKVIVTVRKEAADLIHKVRRLKKSDIKKELAIRKASRNLPEARIRASRLGIPLKRYAAKMAGRKGSKHVVINITGQRKILRHAFIIADIGGKAVGHVFGRKGGARLPIVKKFGPSIGSALIKAATQNTVRQVLRTRWPIVYKRELEFALKKLKR